MKRRWVSARGRAAGRRGRRAPRRRARARAAGQPLALRARARVDDRRQRAILGQRRVDPAVDRLLGLGTARPRRTGSAGRTRSRRARDRAGSSRTRCPPPPAAWPSRWTRRSPRRPASAPRPPAGSSPAGSRAPTGTRSAPRRPRTARPAPRSRSREARASRSAPARRRAAAGPRAPPHRAPAVRRRVLLRVDQRHPAGATRCSASTWSCISDTSGETTSVRSERIAPAAGSRATCPSRWA